MADIFNQAQKMMDKVEEALNKIEDPVDIDIALQLAQVCTLMAQVEQLKRIADCLDAITGIDYVRTHEI